MIVRDKAHVFGGRVCLKLWSGRLTTDGDPSTQCGQLSGAKGTMLFKTAPHTRLVRLLLVFCFIFPSKESLFKHQAHKVSTLQRNAHVKARSH